MGVLQVKHLGGFLFSARDEQLEHTTCPQGTNTACRSRVKHIAHFDCPRLGCNVCFMLSSPMRNFWIFAFMSEFTFWIFSISAANEEDFSCNILAMASNVSDIYFIPAQVTFFILFFAKRRGNQHSTHPGYRLSPKSCTLSLKTVIRYTQSSWRS